RFAAPSAPRFAAPRFTAPAVRHFAPPAAPHFASPAVPRFAAPRFAAPHVAPHIAMPHVAPHVATVPHIATPHVAAPAPFGGRSLAQPLHERGGSAFAHVAPNQLAARGPGTAFVRVVPNLTRPNQGVQTILPASDNRPFAARALTSRAFA